MSPFNRGQMLYKLYRALTYGVSPLLYLHLRWRKFRGLEHPLRWSERLGRTTHSRPPGPLVWFHAVSLGESIAVIPVIRQCLERRPDVTVLMTTTIFSAFEVIKNRLPNGVIYQIAPFDTPSAMDSFLRFWKPDAIMLMESELWPNLIFGASERCIVLALLNARMSVKSFKRWSAPALLPLISLLLSKFSLIAPLGTAEAIRFQLLHAPPFIVNFAGDLKNTANELGSFEREVKRMDELRVQLSGRQIWMAASMHRGEEAVILDVQKTLMETHPNVIMILVPRYPRHGLEFASEFQKQGLDVALRSRHEKITPWTNVYVADTLGELKQLYSLAPIAVIGGSFLPGFAGHNISEAAASGCAVLTGEHVGHFSLMIAEMRRFNPLSVQQVSGKAELEETLGNLFNDIQALEARCMAAKLAHEALSSGVIAKVWKLIEFHILKAKGD